MGGTRASFDLSSARKDAIGAFLLASEPLRLSEARKHYYAQVPEDLLAETRSVLVVYGYLDRRAGRRGWWADTKRGIGRALELNDKSVRTALRRLEELGLVVIEDGDPVQGGRSSRFVLTERSAASGPHFGGSLLT